MKVVTTVPGYDVPMLSPVVVLAPRQAKTTRAPVTVAVSGGDLTSCVAEVSRNKAPMSWRPHRPCVCGGTALGGGPSGLATSQGRTHRCPLAMPAI